MGTDRDLELLAPVVRMKCEQLQREAARIGIEVMWIETLRTPLVQRAYYAQGREPLAVVNAKRADAGLWAIDEEQNRCTITATLESIHFFGCAADFALVIDGKPSWDTKADINEDDSPDYENVGIIAEMLGMEWGGRFRFKDYAHVQYTGGLTREQLRAGMKPTHDPYW